MQTYMQDYLKPSFIPNLYSKRFFFLRFFYHGIWDYAHVNGSCKNYKDWPSVVDSYPETISIACHIRDEESNNTDRFHWYEYRYTEQYIGNYNSTVSMDTIKNNLNWGNTVITIRTYTGSKIFNFTNPNYGMTHQVLVDCTKAAGCVASSL